MPPKKPPKKPSIAFATRRFISQATTILTALAENRDNLQSLLSEYQEILESTEEAHDGLENVIYLISQHV